jgi:hypothetical protein
MGLSVKHRAFVDSLFLHNLNATEAYCDVYGSDRKTGAVNASKLLTNTNIKNEVSRRLEERAMQADEIIDRLSQHARGDMGDFLSIESMGFNIDLAKAKRLGITHLIKKVKNKTTTILTKNGDEVETNQVEIEIYDAKAALDTLAKYRGLLIDRTDITSGGKTIHVTVGGEDMQDDE